ncbi:MAG TPA: nucleic acid/nucleotide deaminase domain-containing protein [Amycolatopsis sp.]|uniref:nucleic acid/nucleotide deaminase domain-containing protein n=1 Tax=Amycolatopsis sp. TaxID=37632 RepID=UPI002F412E9C
MIRRVLGVVLAGVLLLSGTPAVADPPVHLDAPAAPALLSPGPQYPAGLNSRIVAYDQRASALPQQARQLNAEEQALNQRERTYQGKLDAYNSRGAAAKQRLDSIDQRGTALKQRIDAHNAAPHQFLLPQQAAQSRAYDAEASQLRGEQAQLTSELDQLRTEKSALDSEKSQLDSESSQLRDAKRQHDDKARTWQDQDRQLRAEGLRLLGEMAAAQAHPPVSAAPPRVSGGDALRPSARAEQARDTGGDRASPVADTAALRGYAAKNGVDVIPRQVTARLVPDSVAKLPPGSTQLSGVFDGLARKPDGNYTALETQPAAVERGAGQRAFDDAIRHGGRAEVLLDGERVTVDEVRQAPSPAAARPADCPTPNSFLPGTLVVLADGTTRPIEQVGPGTLVRATDPVTGTTSGKPVLSRITGEGRKLLERVTVTDGTRGGVLTATSGHPFWDPARRAWVEARDLRAGEPLSGGLRVAETVPYPAFLTVHNLVVADVHTYWVAADGLLVLVHNGCDGQIGYNSDEISHVAYTARVARGLEFRPGRNVAVARVPGLGDPKTGHFVVGVSKSVEKGTKWHAEDDILDQLAAKGIDPKKITEFYSERKPCAACGPMLDDRLAPGTPVKWSVYYDQNSAVRKAAKEILAMFILQAGGR